mmetsp:Transcript_13453/g.30651  ORF Transcript_13453/g.30651 Transcript_13453/m.30651 type:complete len:101 (+) Transcript_13453:878-1180(+)
MSSKPVGSWSVHELDLLRPAEPPFDGSTSFSIEKSDKFWAMIQSDRSTSGSRIAAFVLCPEQCLVRHPHAARQIQRSELYNIMPVCRVESVSRVCFVFAM